MVNWPLEATGDPQVSCEFYVTLPETLPAWSKTDRIQQWKSILYWTHKILPVLSCKHVLNFTGGYRRSSVETWVTENYLQTWKPNGVCLWPVTFFLLWTRMSIIIIRLSHHVMEQVTCFFSFIAPRIERNCTPEWFIIQTLPIPNLDNLDYEI